MHRPLTIISVIIVALAVAVHAAPLLHLASAPPACPSSLCEHSMPCSWDGPYRCQKGHQVTCYRLPPPAGACTHLCDSRSCGTEHCGGKCSDAECKAGADRKCSPKFEPIICTGGKVVDSCAAGAATFENKTSCSGCCNVTSCLPKPLVCRSKCTAAQCAKYGSHCPPTWTTCVAGPRAGQCSNATSWATGCSDCCQAESCFDDEKKK